MAFGYNSVSTMEAKYTGDIQGVQILLDEWLNLEKEENIDKADFYAD